MNANQRELLSIFSAKLTKYGWYRLTKESDSYSIFENNGCFITIYGANSELNREAKLGDTVLPFTYLVSQYSWTLSRNLVPIISGRLTSSLTRASASGDIDDLVNAITVYASMAGENDYWLYGNAMMREEVVTNSIGDVFSVTENLAGTQYFLVNTKDIPNLIQGQVYRILGINNNGIVLVRIKGNMKESSNVTICEDKIAFKNACLSKKLLPVSKDRGMRETSSVTLKNRINNLKDSKQINCTLLPSSIIELNLPMDKLVAVYQLFIANENFSNLLSPNVDSSNLQAMTQFCINCGYSEDLFNIKATSEQINSIVSYMKHGLDCKLLIENINNINTFVDDKNSYVSSISKVFRESNTADALNGCYYVLGKLNLLQLKGCEKFVDPLLYYYYNIGFMKQTSQFVLERCDYRAPLSALDSNIVGANGITTSRAVRSELRQYFSLSVDFKICNRMWSEILVDIINQRFNNLFFSCTYGFIINFGERYLYRDNNSIVISDKNMHPIWRGICINGTIISNDDAAFDAGLY